MSLRCYGIGGGGGGGAAGSGSGGGGGGAISCIIEGIELDENMGGMKGPANCIVCCGCIACISALGKTPNIPGLFNDESTPKSIVDGGGGGGGGGVSCLAVGAGCDETGAPDLTALECFFEDSDDAEGGR